MPFIEIRGWTRKTAIPYVTNRSPVFSELSLGVHSVNEGILGPEIFINRILEQYLLIYTVDGTGIIEFKNNKLVMDKHKICIFSIDDHIIYYPVNSWHSIWVFIEGDACDNLHKICYGGDVTPTKMSNPEIVDRIFRDMMKNIQTPSIRSDLICSSLMYQLWVILFCLDRTRMWK